MDITSHLEKVQGRGKRFILLIVTPKEKYPRNFLDNNYYVFLNKILTTPDSYMGVFDTDRPEMMQEVAFNIYIRPLIVDYYNMATETKTEIRRLDEEEVKSYFAIRKFYSTVPFGELKELVALELGLSEGLNFLSKYPMDDYEYASVAIPKNNDETQVLMNISFNDINDGYYLNYVYVR